MHEDWRPLTPSEVPAPMAMDQVRQGLITLSGAMPEHITSDHSLGCQRH